jgi:hypothetical protein
MAKRIAVEKAIWILREVEVLQGQGSTVGEACRKLGVSEYTYIGGRRNMDVFMWTRRSGLRSCWPTYRWTMRSLGRLPRETPEPGIAIHRLHHRQSEPA